MEPEGSLPHSQVTTTCPYLDTARIGARLHLLIISSPDSEVWSVSHTGRFILWVSYFSANWEECWVGPKPGLTVWRKEKYLAPAGICTPDHPALNLVILPTTIPRLIT